jgi:hypothetical protein
MSKRVHARPSRGAGKLVINPAHAKCATNATTRLFSHVHYVQYPSKIEY